METELLEKAVARFDDATRQIEKLQAKVLDLQQRSSTGSDFTLAPPRLLSKIASDPQLKALADRTAKSALISLTSPLREIRKATLVGDGSASDGATPQATRSNALGEMALRRLSLLDVLPHLPVGSNSFEYERLDGYSNAADNQATEGAAKAEADTPMGLQSSPIVTIAHWLPCSEQVLADSPALQQQLITLLRHGVLSKLEAEIVAGNTAGKIEGLETVGTPFVPGSSSGPLADLIGEALTALDVAGWAGGLVIMHPNDWHEIRAERTTDSAYVAGGWSIPAAPSIWGVPVVTSPSATEGNPIVLDPSQVVVLDRMQATVEVGRNGDDFTRNKVTLRGELRAGLAIFSPSAVLIVNG